MEQKKLFLVEDNPDHVELFCRALTLLGYGDQFYHFGESEKMLKFFNPPGQKADSIITPYRPRLILLDLKMPKIDGLQALKQLRTDSFTKHIPVVVLTSSGHQQDRQTAYAWGANGYLQKPADFEELKMILEAVIKYWLTWNKVCYE